MIVKTKSIVGVGDVHHQGAITIGESLEATARTASSKAVEQTDFAAIQVAKDATVKLAADKAATREDVDGVFNAERRNNPNSIAHPTEVAASIAAAANLNEKEFVM
ncbi:late embryogenesis abundant protein D-34-like protein [Tanacetum coccineum]